MVWSHNVEDVAPGDALEIGCYEDGTVYINQADSETNVWEAHLHTIVLVTVDAVVRVERPKAKEEE